jgi:hypothetical protein
MQTKFAGFPISFAKRSLNIPHVPAPIGGELSPFYIAMKTAMRPIGRTGNVTVLHGIEMNVIDMSIEITIIADSVLPIATLPDAFLSLGDLAFRSWPRFETA